MTTVYLIRHSEILRVEEDPNTSEIVQLRNEKCPLSIHGEKIAEEFAANDEFKNLNEVWSSNYVRAMCTAKYFAHNNGIKVKIDDRLGERLQGITYWGELPEDYRQRQFEDETYKYGNGENQIEVNKRMSEVFYDILSKNQGKRVAIISHNTALTFLLRNWLKIYHNAPYTRDGKEVFDGHWNYLETFKLVFDENNNLQDIKNLRF